MPYNPTVQDRSGELLAAGINSGTNALSNGYQQYQQHQASSALMQGKLEQMHQMDPNMVTSDMLNKFAAGNLNAKREVFSMADLAMTQRQIDAQRQMQQQGIDIQMLKANNEAAFQNASLAMTKEQLDRIHPEGGVQPTVTPLVDPTTGQTFGYSVPTSPGQNQVIPNTPKIQQGDPSQGPMTKKVNGIDYHWSREKQDWLPVIQPWMNGLMGGGMGGGTPGVSITIPSGSATGMPDATNQSPAPATPVAATAPSAPKSIPPAAAAYLKANPTTRAAFDAKFGQGASQQILGN